RCPYRSWFAPPGDELRLVTLVEGNQAVQLAALQHGPAPAGRLVHLVVALPGPLDGRQPVPGRLPAVHDAVDVAEVELALATALELDVALLLCVDEVLVPHRHRHDVPAALEGRWRFGPGFGFGHDQVS